MFGNKSKIASSRRLKAPFAHETHSQPAQQPATAGTEQTALKARQQAPHTRTAANTVSQHHICKSSKSQALAAFHGLVENASRARLGLPQPGAPLPTTAAVSVADHVQEPHDSKHSHPHNDQRAVPAAEHGSVGTAMPASSPHPHSGPLLNNPQQQPPHRPPHPSAVQLLTNPTQLIPKASKALQKLHQQLNSRTLTYLYQFDALLQQAKNATAAVASYSSSQGPGVAVLLQLAEHQGQQSAEAAADALLHLCVNCWEVIMLLLQHHHAAEPANTANQAMEFHDSARLLWDAYENAAQESLTAGSAVAGRDGEPENSGKGPHLRGAVLAALKTLAQVASAWSDIAEADIADWHYLQLRKQLCSISKAAGDSSLSAAARKELQQLQMTILQGNILLVARQGQQVLWTNLTTMLRQLLSTSILDPEDTISNCLILAGALAEQAKTLSTSEHSNKKSTGQHSAGAAAPAVVACAAGVVNTQCSKEVANRACRMLQYAAELLEYCRGQVEALMQMQQELQQQQQQESAAGVAGSDEAQMMVVQHVSSIQQQVLLQLGQAYLADQQHAKALDCVNHLRGLSTGLTPPPGLIQLSTLALLGQGKHTPACAQLCAWLKQSGPSSSSSRDSSTVQEAVAAVDAFLQALHGQKCDAGTVAEVVEMVATAAVEHCAGDPAVAVAVVKQLFNIEATGIHHTSLEQLVVKLLALEDVAQQIMKDAENLQLCHNMLHQRGQAHYEAHNYSSAIELLTPAVFFSTTVTVGKSARLLAMSLLKTRQPQKAVDYITLAEQQEGHITALGCLIRLQALLVRPKPAAVAAEGSAKRSAGSSSSSSNGPEEILSAVQLLSACADVNSQSMQAAFSLCMQAGNTSAAWELLKLWSKTPPSAAVAAQATADHRAAASAMQSAAAAEAASAAKAHGGQCNIQILVLMYNLHQQEQRSHPGSSSSSSTNFEKSMLADLCDMFCECTMQLSDLPVVAPPKSQSPAAAAPAAAATMNKPSTAMCYSQQQLTWLIDVGMQLGLQAVAAGIFDLAAQFMKQASAGCATLQQQQREPGGNQQATGIDVTAANNQRSGASMSIAALTAVCMRHLSALATAITLLLQPTPIAAGQQQQQLKQAKELLSNGQRQLLVLQQLYDSSDYTQVACRTAGYSEQQQQAASTPELLADLSALQFLYGKVSFAVASREHDEPSMKRSLQQMVQNPHAKPLDFYAAARECLNPTGAGGHRNETVAALAYGYMLRVATAVIDLKAAAAGDKQGVAAAAAVDMAAVSDAVAGIMGLVSSHAVRVKVCSKVAAVIASQQQQQQVSSSSKACAFPAKRLQWLLITCWNAAVQLCSSKTAVAAQYLDCVDALATCQVAAQQVDNAAAAAAGCEPQPRPQQTHWLVGSRQYRVLRSSLQTQASCEQRSGKLPAAAADECAGGAAGAAAAARACGSGSQQEPAVVAEQEDLLQQQQQQQQQGGKGIDSSSTGGVHQRCSLAPLASQQKQQPRESQQVQVDKYTHALAAAAAGQRYHTVVEQLDKRPEPESNSQRRDTAEQARPQLQQQQEEEGHRVMRRKADSRLQADQQQESQASPAAQTQGLPQQQQQQSGVHQAQPGQQPLQEQRQSGSSQERNTPQHPTQQQQQQQQLKDGGSPQEQPPCFEQREIGPEGNDKQETTCNSQQQQRQQPQPALATSQGLQQQPAGQPSRHELEGNTGDQPSQQLQSQSVIDVLPNLQQTSGEQCCQPAVKGRNDQPTHAADHPMQVSQQQAELAVENSRPCHSNQQHHGQHGEQQAETALDGLWPIRHTLSPLCDRAQQQQQQQVCNSSQQARDLAKEQPEKLAVTPIGSNVKAAAAAAVNSQIEKVPAENAGLVDSQPQPTSSAVTLQHLGHTRTQQAANAAPQQQHKAFLNPAAEVGCDVDAEMPDTVAVAAVADHLCPSRSPSLPPESCEMDLDRILTDADPLAAAAARLSHAPAVAACNSEGAAHAQEGSAAIAAAAAMTTVADKAHRSNGVTEMEDAGDLEQAPMAAAAAAACMPSTAVAASTDASRPPHAAAVAHANRLMKAMPRVMPASTPAAAAIAVVVEPAERLLLNGELAPAAAAAQQGPADTPGQPAAKNQTHDLTHTTASSQAAQLAPAAASLPGAADVAAAAAEGLPAAAGLPAPVAQPMTDAPAASRAADLSTEKPSATDRSPATANDPMIDAPADLATEADLPAAADSAAAAVPGLPATTDQPMTDGPAASQAAELAAVIADLPAAGCTQRCSDYGDVVIATPDDCLEHLSAAPAADARAAGEHTPTASDDGDQQKLWNDDHKAVVDTSVVQDRLLRATGSQKHAAAAGQQQHIVDSRAPVADIVMQCNTPTTVAPYFSAKTGIEADTAASQQQQPEAMDVDPGTAAVAQNATCPRPEGKLAPCRAATVEAAATAAATQARSLEARHADSQSQELCLDLHGQTQYSYPEQPLGCLLGPPADASAAPGTGAAHSSPQEASAAAAEQLSSEVPVENSRQMPPMGAVLHNTSVLQELQPRAECTITSACACTEAQPGIELETSAVRVASSTAASSGGGPAGGLRAAPWPGSSGGSSKVDDESLEEGGSSQGLQLVLSAGTDDW